MLKNFLEKNQLLPLSCLCAFACALLLALAFPAAAHAEEASPSTQISFVTTYMNQWGFYCVMDDNYEDDAVADFYLAEFFTDMANEGFSDYDIETLRDWLTNESGRVTSDQALNLGLVPRNILQLLNQYCLGRILNFTSGDDKTWPYYHSATIFESYPTFEIHTPVGNRIRLKNSTAKTAWDKSKNVTGQVELRFDIGDYRYYVGCSNAFGYLESPRSDDHYPFVAVCGNVYNCGVWYENYVDFFWPDGTVLFPGYDFGSANNRPVCNYVWVDKRTTSGYVEYNDYDYGTAGYDLQSALEQVFGTKYTLGVQGYLSFNDFSKNFLQKLGAVNCEITMNLDSLSDLATVNGYTVVMKGMSVGFTGNLTNSNMIDLYGWAGTSHLLQYLPDLDNWSSDNSFRSNVFYDANSRVFDDLTDIVETYGGDIRNAASDFQVVGNGYEYMETDEGVSVVNAGSVPLDASGGANSNGTGVASSNKSSVVSKSQSNVVSGSGAGSSVSTAVGNNTLGGGSGSKVDSPGTSVPDYVPGGSSGDGTGDGGGSGDGDGTGDGGGSGDGSGGSADFSGGSWLNAKFPFCLPYDFQRAVSYFAADPVAPSFDWYFPSPSGKVKVTIDLSPFNDVAAVLRTVMLVSLICGCVFLAVRFINMLRSAAD